MTIYDADWLCPISSPPIRNGSLAVENGTVAAVYDRRQSGDLEIAGGHRPPLQFKQFGGKSGRPSQKSQFFHAAISINN